MLTYEDPIAGMVEQAVRKPIAKFESVGDTLEGVVAGVRARQLRDFESKAPEVWEDGTPKLTPIITIGDDDEGADVYVRGSLYMALANALRESGIRTTDDLVGCGLRIEFCERKKQRKLYQITITAPTVS